MAPREQEEYHPNLFNAKKREFRQSSMVLANQSSSLDVTSKDMHGALQALPNSTSQRTLTTLFNNGPRNQSTMSGELEVRH